MDVLVTAAVQFICEGSLRPVKAASVNLLLSDSDSG